MARHTSSSNMIMKICLMNKKLQRAKRRQSWKVWRTQTSWRTSSNMRGKTSSILSWRDAKTKTSAYIWMLNKANWTSWRFGKFLRRLSKVSSVCMKKKSCIETSRLKTFSWPEMTRQRLATWDCRRNLFNQMQLITLQESEQLVSWRLK